MISFTRESRSTIRNCGLEWRCHEVVINQSGVDHGYTLKGYGEIKTNRHGALYIDFVCLESNKEFDFQTPVPSDPLDPLLQLTMKAVTLEGYEIESRGFAIKSSFQQTLLPNPKLYSFILDSVEVNERESSDCCDSFLLMEFNEKCDIPANKLNKIESTLGEFSSDWNQANLECDGLEINIISHKDCTEVTVQGGRFDVSIMKESILFYMEFVSGKFIQPYFEYVREGEVSKSYLYSIDKRKIKNSIPKPIDIFLRDGDKTPTKDYHYELLENIIYLVKNSPSRFESVNSQWRRIWHSFLSKEFSVPMLTVSVAIEGILNDIFIPEIMEDLSDENLEGDKEKIVKLLDKLEGVSEEHLKSIQGYVGRWGNVHAKKALQYLVDKGVVEKKQMNIWSDLRNSSAHPKFRRMDDIRTKKDLGRTIVCLGLFYRLVLNIFSYRGAQYRYGALNDNELVVYDHIKILS